MRKEYKIALVRIFYCMNVCQLSRGETAVVIQVKLPSPVKERLRSLNICADMKITLLKASLLKKTFLLQAGSAQVAMRREVACQIEVMLQANV